MIFTQFDIIWTFLFGGILCCLAYFYYTYAKQHKIISRKYSLLLRNDTSLAQMTFLVISIIVLALGLLGPQVIQKTENQSIDGIDVMIVLDVSKSMNALDFEDKNNFYTRIEAAKLIVKNFVVNNPQNRYGLVVFAGDSVNVSPLTNDQNIFLTFLQSVDYRNVSAQGSNLALAYELGIKRLSVDSENSALILISDGGDTDDTLNTNAVKKAYDSQKNYSVILGIGTSEGAKIPDGQDIFGYTNYQVYQGKEVITKLNEKNLQKIASLTEGDYIQISSLEDISEIENKLKNIETKAIEKGNTSDYIDMRRLLSFIAFISFLVYLLIPIFKSSQSHHT